MRRRSLVTGFAATIAAAALPGDGRAHDTPPAGETAPPLGSEIVFELVDLEGHTVRAADLRRRWLIVFFGYTSCPDLCPTALSELSSALAQLGPLTARLQPIFVTIDPERDTPEALREYVRSFDDRILALTGTAERVSAAARSFGVVFYKVPGKAPGEFTFAHSAIASLIGPEGGLVARFSTDSTADELAGALRRLIAPVGS